MKRKVSTDQMIGKQVKASNKNLTIIGEVVDETRNMFTIKTEKGNKKIIKKNVTLHTIEKTVQGDRFVGRPEERIKK